MMEDPQLRQEREYYFPYHYIPRYYDDKFFQFVNFGWGMNYLAGIERVLNTLEELQFDSLLDVGCGDGRFLAEASERFPKIATMGIDYSERAINFAKSFNPSLSYKWEDITKSDSEQRFDVITLIEVLEHIPPSSIADFLNAINSRLNSNGTIVLTVPHKNKPLQKKHYQHFDSDTLESTLKGTFSRVDIYPFDKKSRLERKIWKFLGGAGKNYLITNPKINNWLYQRVKRNCFERIEESKCQRLLAIVRR